MLDMHATTKGGKSRYWVILHNVVCSEHSATSVVGKVRLLHTFHSLSKGCGTSLFYQVMKSWQRADAYLFHQFSSILRFLLHPIQISSLTSR